MTKKILANIDEVIRMTFSDKLKKMAINKILDGLIFKKTFGTLVVKVHKEKEN